MIRGGEETKNGASFYIHKAPDNLSKKLGMAIQDCLRERQFPEKYPYPLGSHLSKYLNLKPTIQCIFLPPVCVHSQVSTHTSRLAYVLHDLCMLPDAHSELFVEPKLSFW